MQKQEHLNNNKFHLTADKFNLIKEINMKLAMTTVSSRGQIVIPQEIRKGFPEGEKLIIMRKDDQLLIEKVSELGNKFKEEWEFAKKTEETIKRIENGEKTLSEEEFLKEIEL